MTTRHGARYVFALLTVGLTLAGSSLADQGPEALIDAIYAPFLTGKTELPAKKVYCADTLKKLKALEAREPMGLDFSPFVDGQDYELKGLRKRSRTATATQVEMEVSFSNMGVPKSLVYDLRAERGQWCVNDIKGGQGARAWSVRRLLLP